MCQVPQVASWRERNVWWLPWPAIQCDPLMLGKESIKQTGQTCFSERDLSSGNDDAWPCSLGLSRYQCYWKKKWFDQILNQKQLKRAKFSFSLFLLTVQRVTVHHEMEGFGSGSRRYQLTPGTVREQREKWRDGTVKSQGLIDSLPPAKIYLLMDLQHSQTAWPA